MGPRRAGQFVGCVLPVTGDPAAHARPVLWPHHQHQLGDRLVGQHRPGQLRRCEVRHVWPHHEPRAGNRPQRHHRQRRDAGRHQHRHDRVGAGGSSGEGSLPRSPWAVSASQKRSRELSNSSPPRPRATSPARFTPSMAACTCSSPCLGRASVIGAHCSALPPPPTPRPVTAFAGPEADRDHVSPAPTLSQADGNRLGVARQVCPGCWPTITAIRPADTDGDRTEPDPARTPAPTDPAVAGLRQRRCGGHRPVSSGRSPRRSQAAPASHPLPQL